ERLFHAGERLITILGPGGIGKTRLALECAQRLSQRGIFTEGVRVCDLTEVQSLDGVVACIARELEMQLTSETDNSPLERLTKALQRRAKSASGRRLLLVLDNCEQVGDAVASVLTSLLTAEGTCFLMTSRERLRLPGEHALDLEPLDTPRVGVS